MNKLSFTDCINALQKEYLKDPILDKNYDFWFVVDRLETKELIKWCDKLSHIRCLEGNDWAILCSILNQVKHDKIPMSPKQKRKMAILLVKSWDDISIRFEY